MFRGSAEDRRKRQRIAVARGRKQWAPRAVEAAAVAPKLSPVWTSNLKLSFNLGSLGGPREPDSLVGFYTGWTMQGIMAESFMKFRIACSRKRVAAVFVTSSVAPES